MPGRLGANSASSGFFNASGEATPQAALPEKYVPAARSTNAINGAVTMRPDWNGNVRRQPIVQRAQRVVGMRYLYARGNSPMPIHPLGADGTPYPWTSKFQPNIFGLIHNGGFNDGLFQAGYPGYNLGLSFKVQQTDRNQNVLTGGPGSPAMRATGPKSNKGGSRTTVQVGRALGR
jgi:hypothetical protein